MKTFLYTPLMDISSRNPGQWAIYDLSIIKGAWIDIANRHYKFIETYFPDKTKDICADVILELNSADEIVGILQEERRRAFGTTWNRSCFVTTQDTPKSPVWIPNLAGSTLLEGDIRTLCSIIMTNRIFGAFQEKFPEILEIPTPKGIQQTRPSFNKPSKEDDSNGIKIYYMQISRACAIPFNQSIVDHMKWAIDHLSKGFALQKSGYDLSIKSSIDEVTNAGFRVGVPMESIKIPTTFPAVYPISYCYEAATIPTKTRYIVDVYKDGKFWKRKQGFMVPFAFMEMWYKLLEQMTEINAKSYAITMLYVQCPEEEPEDAKPI